MTRPVPESRTISRHELECAAEAMDGYTQSAAEAIADHGDLITDTHPHVLAAAYMQGVAAIHAAHVVAEPLHAIARELARIADEQEKQTIARQRQASNLFELANAVNGLADNVKNWLASAVSSVAEALSNDVAPAIAALAPRDRNPPHPDEA